MKIFTFRKFDERLIYLGEEHKRRARDVRTHAPPLTYTLRDEENVEKWTEDLESEVGISLEGLG